jgi:Cellulase (glycosyl hydrolase family 5)/Calx-beta domain
MVALTSATYTAAPSSTAIVAIYRTGNPSGAATVGYTTLNGTAIAGSDYTATSGTVSWSDGETAVRTVAVPVMSRAAGKQFGVALTSVEGQAYFGSPSAASVAVAFTGSTGSGRGGVSASGTMVPTNAKQITDGTLSVWTLNGGVVYQQAAGAASASTAGYSANVTLLLYYNGVVYQQSSACLWWSWSGGAWVATSNPAASITPACGSSTSAVKAPSTTGAGIAVSGNKFINTATGKPVVLAGANLDGLDGSGGYGGAGQIKQWNIIAGISSAQWAAIAAKWGINMIRLPLNSDYWLNPTVYDDPAAAAIETGACCYTSIGAGKYTPDASGSYQSVIATVVSNITAAGIVVSLDLHCDAPKNSSGQYIACVGETSYASSDTAPTFWMEVANTFKSNPMVMFELFNEPYGGPNYNSAPGAVNGGGASATPGAYAVKMIAGGTSPYTMLANDKTLVSLSGGAALNVASMTGLISTIRNTGATNVILASPIWYAGQIQTWLDSYTTTAYGRTSAGNPDPIGQLAVAWHDYGWSSGTATPLAILAAGYPICITETYGLDSALDGGSNASGYTWAGSNGIGVLVWAWATWASGGASTPAAFYNYLLNTGPWTTGNAPIPTGNSFGQSTL